MTSRRFLPVFALIALLFGLSACEPVPPSGPSGPNGPGRLTAELRTAGPGAVRLNSAPARDGQRVRSGDSVATGAGASALVVFSDGTTVQLDEDSGPVALRWRGDELVIEMRGSFVEYVKGAAIRVVTVITDLYEAVAESRFIVEMERGRFVRFDLFDGRLELVRPPHPRVVGGGEYVVLRRGAAPEFGRSSRAYLRRIERRFDRWDFAAAPRPTPPPTPPAATPSCPDGQRWDPAQRVCACPPELPYWQNGQCVTCVGGMVWTGRQCACPDGTRWDGDRCVRVQAPAAPEICAGGRRWDPMERACVCPPELPYLQNGQCITCIGGMVWTGRQCACPDGARWDGARCVPVSTPTPPRGAIPRPLLLTPTIICPDGERWSPEAERCLPVVQ